MPDGRFGRLEIPADRQADLSFLDTPVSLPRPLPSEEYGVAAYVNGRVYVPGDGRDTLHLYDLSRPLAVVPDPEGTWRSRHASAFAALSASVRGRIPLAMVGDEHARRGAVDGLKARSSDEIPDRGKALGAVATDASAWLRVVGHARMLRLCDKLYDLQTLSEYTQRFSKAIDPQLMTLLQRLPVTASPADFLDVIGDNLDKIHTKARSPLRNKMDTSRVVIDGITLLPIYVAPVRGLFERYGERLADEVRRTALEGP